MRIRTVTVLAAVATLTTAACSGDDDAADTGAETTDATVPTATVPPTTTVEVLIDPDRCDDDPDAPAGVDASAPEVIRPCVVPDELVVTTLRDGTGVPAEAGDAVIYHYARIRAEDGVLIDSSYATGAPVNLPAVGRGAEIPGLDEALTGARAGELLRIDIPGDLAYGDQPPADGSGVIRAGDALTYMVDVQGVIPVVVPEDAPLELQLEPSVDTPGLTTTDLVEGEGRAADLGTTVIVNMLIVRGDNLVVLFNGWNDGAAIAIPLDPALMTGPEPVTLPGIFEGLQGATPGTRRVMTLPPELAWGPEGQPQLGLPAETDVIVVADVLAVY